MLPPSRNPVPPKLLAKSKSPDRLHSLEASIRARTMPRSPKLQRIPEEPAPAPAGPTLHNYRVVLSSLLSKHGSSFLEREIICGKGPTKAHEDEKRAAPEPVLKEYCETSAAVVWPEGLGIVRKGTKVGERQGVVMMKSLQLSWTQIESGRKSAKEFYIPFRELPSLLHLRTRALRVALSQFVGWSPAGEFGFSLPKGECEIRQDFRSRYTGGEERMVFYMREGDRRTYQVVVGYMRFPSQSR